MIGCRRAPGCSDPARAWLIMPFFPSSDSLPTRNRTWFDAEDWTALIEWLKAFEASERFQAIMPKWEKWHSGDAPVVFPIVLEKKAAATR